MAGGLFGGGDGSLGNPFLVEDAADLNAVRNGLDQHYKQAADINLSSWGNFEPIGYEEDLDPYERRFMPFTGSYDGDGHEIQNAYIYFPIMGLGSYCGLFSFVEAPGEIKNLTIRDTTVPEDEENPNDEAGDYAGGLVAQNFGVLTNCGCINSVISGEMAAGGLVGINYGTIVDCSSENSDVVGAYYAGGLIGANFYGVMTNCNNADSVVLGRYVGGLVGFILYGGATEECHSRNSELFGLYVGGLVGVSVEGSISNCYSTGDNIHGSAIEVYGDVSPGYCGGFVGIGFDDTITNCYSTGTPNGGENVFVGGFAGEYAGVITGCYYDSDTSGQSDTGKGEPRTSAQMKTQETFAGWDFESVWSIATTINDGYPHLGVSPVTALVWVNSDVQVLSVAWTAVSSFAPIRDDAEIIRARYRVVTKDLADGGYFDSLGFFRNLLRDKITGNNVVYFPVAPIAQGESLEIPVFGAVTEAQVVAAHLVPKEAITGRDGDYAQIQLVNKGSEQVLSTLTFIAGIDALAHEVISFGPVNQYGEFEIYKGMSYRVEQVGMGMALPELALIIEWNLR